MYLLGHTDSRFTMRVCAQVFDAGPQTVAQLETVLGCSLEEAFAIYSERQASGRFVRAASGEAADGIRTHDLLHGKQTL
jgi:hypothetical protein